MAASVKDWYWPRSAAGMSMNSTCARHAGRVADRVRQVEIAARLPGAEVEQPARRRRVEQPQHHVHHVADPDEVAPLLRRPARPGWSERNSRAGPPAATSSCLTFTTEIIAPLWYSFGP